MSSELLRPTGPMGQVGQALYVKERMQAANKMPGHRYLYLSEGMKEVCHAGDSQNWHIRVKSSRHRFRPC